MSQTLKSPARMTTEKQKLAYLVKADEACEIIYATSGAAARRQGAQQLGIDFEDVESCCRAAYLDQYLGTDGPPANVLIEEHNWHFECGNCFEEVSQLVEERVYDEYEAPYCCAACLAESQQKAAAHKAAQEEMTQAVATRWPGATICWMNAEAGTAFLRIESAKAGASWLRETDQLICQPHDEANWNAYKQSLQAA